MLYFVMQLHFYLYTHQKMVDSVLTPLLVGAIVGLCIGSIVVL